MKLGYVTVQGKGRIDLLLAEVVERLEARGMALAGTVQTNIERHDRPRCDMDLRLLPDGPVVRISVDRGAEARGCRLDAGALEQSTLWVAGALAKAELLVVNKFGKQEALGQGLRAEIAAGFLSGLPLLTAVREDMLGAWGEFVGEAWQRLPPERAAIEGWALSCLRQPA